jgi:hypothetical protein
MSDSNSEVHQLDKLVKKREEIDREIRDLSTRWGQARGRLPLYIISPDTISTSYWIFLAVSFVVGIIFTFLKGTFSNLGVALVVGSLFAGGAVVGQVWSLAFQERQSLLEKALGDERTKNLEKLGEEFWESRKDIDHLLDNKTRKKLKKMLTSIYPDPRKLCRASTGQLVRLRARPGMGCPRRRRCTL